MLSERASVKWHLACGRGSVSVSFIPLLSGENRGHPESFTPVACISYNKALAILHWDCLALFSGNRYRRKQLWIGTRDVCISAGLHFAHGNMTAEFVAPWTVSPLAPLSMEFSKQEYWSGLPVPTPGDLPNPGVEPTSLVSPALAGGFFTTCTTWEVPLKIQWLVNAHQDWWEFYTWWWSPSFGPGAWCITSQSNMGAEGRASLGTSGEQTGKAAGEEVTQPPPGHCFLGHKFVSEICQ